MSASKMPVKKKATKTTAKPGEVSGEAVAAETPETPAVTAAARKPAAKTKSAEAKGASASVTKASAKSAKAETKTDAKTETKTTTAKAAGKAAKPAATKAATKKSAAGKAAAAAADGEAAPPKKLAPPAPRQRQRAGDRRVACQGEDHQEVPRRGLHGEGVGRPREGPAEEDAGHRHRARLPARVRGHRRQEEGAGRDQGSGRDRVADLPRARPRSRRRGDRLAHRRGDPPVEPQHPPRAVQRDHQEGDPRGDRQADRARQQEVRVAAGAPRPRSSGRLPDQPGAVDQGQARAVGGARAVGRGAPDLRARGGDRGVQAAGVLVGRGQRRGRATRRRSSPRCCASTARRPSWRTRGRRREAVDAIRGATLRVASGRAQGAQEVRAAALHHVEAAAGGVEQAALLAQADHVAVAAPVRGRRGRRRRAGRSHHVHAYRLDPSVRRRGHRRARVHRRALRRGVAAGGADRLQDQEERAGRARGDPPDVAEVRSREGASGLVGREGRRPRRARDRGSAEALHADLEPLRRLPDGAGGLRPDQHRHRGGARRPARDRAGDEGPGLPRGLRRDGRGGRRRRRRRSRGRAARGAAKAKSCGCSRSSPSSTSPSRRRASPRRRWSRSWRRRASAGRRPTRRSCRRSRTAATSRSARTGCTRPSSASWSTACWSRASPRSSAPTSPRRWRSSWTRSRTAPPTGSSCCRGSTTPFKIDLDKAKIEMRDVKREEQKTDEVCEKCGKPMVIKWGRNGHFLACSGYPDCRNTKEYTRNSDGSLTVRPTTRPSDQICPTCGSPMVIRRGRFGEFLACTRYPDCKTTSPMSLGITCPKEGCGGYLTREAVAARQGVLRLLELLEDPVRLRVVGSPDPEALPDLRRAVHRAKGQQGRHAPALHQARVRLHGRRRGRGVGDGAPPRAAARRPARHRRSGCAHGGASC